MAGQVDREEGQRRQPPQDLCQSPVTGCLALPFAHLRVTDGLICKDYVAFHFTPHLCKQIKLSVRLALKSKLPAEPRRIMVEFEAHPPNSSNVY
jgi:hypothetical protein